MGTSLYQRAVSIYRNDSTPPLVEGLVDWRMPRSPVQRPGFIQTPGDHQGGREGGEEGKVLWRAKSSEREGEGEV